MTDEKYLHSDISSKILQAFFTVYNEFGYGFSKSVYERSMLIELEKLGLNCEYKIKIKLYYQGKEVGECIGDILVNNSVLINIQSKEPIDEDDVMPVYYFLRVSEIEVGLFLNFGKTPVHKRKVFTNELKKKKVNKKYPDNLD